MRLEEKTSPQEKANMEYREDTGFQSSQLRSYILPFENIISENNNNNNLEKFKELLEILGYKTAAK